MSDHISQIAQFLTEDPDILVESDMAKTIKDIKKAWEKKTTVPYKAYYQALKTIKKIAGENDLYFNVKNVKVKLNQSNIELHNIDLTPKNSKATEKLARKLAQETGDSSILNGFGDNLKANLLTAISGQLNDNLKSDRSLEVSFSQWRPDPGEAEGSERAEILPVITLQRTQIKMEPPEPEMPEPEIPGMGEPPMPGVEEPGIGGMGGMGGLPMGDLDMGPPLEGEPLEGEMPPEEMPPGGEFEGGEGEFEGEEGAETAEEKALIKFPSPETPQTLAAGYINKIADLITEDPDILNGCR